MSTRSIIGRNKHRRTAPPTDAELESRRQQLAETGRTAVEQFVRSSLPRILRTVRPGGHPLHPDTPAELHQAAWQVSNCVGQLQNAARQDLLASIEPLLDVLVSQRRMLAQQQQSLSDPNQLASMMRLDHANAMAHHGVLRALVLAGGPWPDTRRGPTTLVAVAQGAQCAIAGYRRVQVAGDSAVKVRGDVVEPLMTALVELLDNAVRAAGGEEPVHLHVGRGADGGALVTITDTGPGMDDLALAQAIALVEGRLHPAADSTPAPGTLRPAPFGQTRPRIGLRTVAAAAAVIGTNVQLQSVPGSGTRATVHLPVHLLAAPADATPALPASAPTPDTLEDTVR
ncbi:ATP-binding protein [Kitasatospora sp. NPDC006697]|uniref:ATP-binding protein n=1 Tax=unclassified Kitasatospora TaxID=2633591 RepID=UPI003674BD28